MKLVRYIPAFIIVFLSSCEKVIEIDLNSSSPQYVVEGKISNGTEPTSVKITRSKNFDENNDFPAVSGALVTISDSHGKTFTLKEITPGNYEDPTLVGIEGVSYMLTISIDGLVFSAKSTMPQGVKLEDLTYEEMGVFDKRIMPQPVFLDSPNVSNYYRFVVWINNTIDKGVFVLNDESSDGKLVQRSFFTNTEIKTGDSLRVEMQCVDASVYSYFNSLSKIAGEGMSGGSPGNPISNIKGGALGYFSAYSSDSKSIKVIK